MASNGAIDLDNLQVPDHLKGDATLGRQDPAHSVDDDYSPERNIERTKAYYATPRADRGPLLADDFVFAESPSFPVWGNFKGLEGILAITPTLLSLFDCSIYRIKEYTGGGNFTVALMELGAEALDGSIIHMQVAEVFHWERGKLKMIQPHWFDLAALERAIQTKRNRLMLEASRKE